MKIEHLLHPELILDRRGPKSVRQTYVELLNAIELHDDDGELRFYHDRISDPQVMRLCQFAVQNKPALRAYELWKRFKVTRAECFYLPRSFCKALRSVDKELVYEDFPSEFIGYFALPKGAYQTPTGFEINGGYVRIHRPTREQVIPAERYLQMIFMADVDSEEGPRIISQQMPLLPNKTLREGVDDWAAKSKEVDPRLCTLMHELGKIVVNAVLFIFHMDETIVALKPNGNRSNRERQALKQKQQGMENACTVPVNVVSFDFHQNRTLSYSVESTDVVGYWRTQHWGPRRDLVKKVFIEAHTRHFTTKLEIPGPVHSAD